ncbi:MAG: 2-C-methyl-D-erythritol 4-phosphate cytidylyltransferase [Defluviitaleaceae bacterium]|nr:2-C-methyl-D-erythritol 4-phosphate cytidylyltransferase [Defluviitaleaceae bacterium]
MSVAVIIAASGKGTRLGGHMPKQFQQMGGKPVLAHTLETFNRLDIIGTIIIAAPAEYAAYTQEITAGYGCGKVQAIVPGGENRAVSVYAALKQLPVSTDIVLVHDGVRPFVTARLINAVAESASKHGAAIAGTILTDTLKEADENGQIIATPNREKYWRIQTPQGFTYKLIMEAYAKGEKDGVLGHVTDDSALVERLGVPVQIVEGHPGNIKITTKEDLWLGELLLQQEAGH